MTPLKEAEDQMDEKGKFEYFIARTDERLHAIEGKIDRLLAFKWQIIGGAGVVGLIASIIISFAAELLKR